MNFLFNHLLNYFLFAATMFFAAGAVADAGAQDGGDETATGSDQVRSGEGASGDNVSDDAGAGSAGSGAADDATGDDESGKDGQRDGAQDQEGKLDARTLPPSVKSALTELQKTDPKAHAWLKDRLWAEKRFRDAVPGGLEEVTKLQTSVNGLKEIAGPQYANSAPEEVIGAIKAEVSEWRQIDTMLDKGDANVLATIAEQFPEGFKKLLPLALNEFASRDLPNYQKHMAGVIEGELQAGNVEGRLDFIDELLAAGNVASLKTQLGKLRAFLMQYRGIASKKIDEPQVDPKQQTREQELNTREHQIWVNETSGPINREKLSLVKSAVQQYVPKGETLDDETLAAIEVHVNRFLDPLLQSDPTFASTFGEFEKNRDAEGMKKFVLSKIKELLPSKQVNGKSVMGPAEKATRLFFRQAPKAAPKPGQQQQQQRQQAAPKGWERVSPDKAPAPHEIDRIQTPFEMSFAKAAVLKNGKKVFWGDKAPA